MSSAARFLLLSCVFFGESIMSWSLGWISAPMHFRDTRDDRNGKVPIQALYNCKVKFKLLPYCQVIYVVKKVDANMH